MKEIISIFEMVFERFLLVEVNEVRNYCDPSEVRDGKGQALASGSVGWSAARAPNGCWLIPGRGTCLGGGFDPWSGVYGRQQIDISRSRQCVCLSLLSSKNC